MWISLLQPCYALFTWWFLVSNVHLFFINQKFTAKRLSLAVYENCAVKLWRRILSDSNVKLYRYGNHIFQWSTSRQWFYSGLEILKTFVKNNCIHETPVWLEFIIIILYIIFRAFSIEGKTLETLNNTTLSVHLFCPCRAGLIKRNKSCYCDVENVDL